MATRKTVIVAGDKELNAMFNALEKKTANKLFRTAARSAAKLVLEHAKAIVPRKTGAFARSLTVRAMRRSRVRKGYKVTQRLAYAGKGKSGREAFYGVFQELGWTAAGQGSQTRTIIRTRLGLPAAEPKVQKPREPRKIEGRWLVRKAGKDKENQAVRFYEQELRPLWSTLLVPTTLIIVMGVWGIMMGIVALIQAFTGGGWGAGILGILSIIFGIILLANPLFAAIGLPFILGIFAVVAGIAALVVFFMK